MSEPSAKQHGVEGAAGRVFVGAQQGTQRPAGGDQVGLLAGAIGRQAGDPTREQAVGEGLDLVGRQLVHWGGRSDCPHLWGRGSVGRLNSSHGDRSYLSLWLGSVRLLQQPCGAAPGHPGTWGNLLDRWERRSPTARRADRKSTRLNSSHLGISYAVFCLKK